MESQDRAGRAIITLTTDFGSKDVYVGVMKGVILGIAPDAVIVDISHSVRPQNVRQAGFLLASATPYFPPNTIHIVVVDPGVGTERRAIAVQTQRAWYVAPDNGVLSFVLNRESALRIVNLTNARYWLPTVSATFHGRDVFAPVAAHLARGVSVDDLGEPVDEIVTLPLSQPTRRADGSIVGHVLHIDQFGNCVTDIPAEMLAATPHVDVEVAGCRIRGLVPTYAMVAPGAPVVLIGSVGYLEIAVREGSAACQMGIEVGEQVVVRPSLDPV